MLNAIFFLVYPPPQCLLSCSALLLSVNASALTILPIEVVAIVARLG